MKILILGGTAEARTLAERLVAMGHEVITSLAGRTQAPALPAGTLRMGGFGGIAGLASYLRAAGIERMVDATHPYAGQISRHAVAAARESGVKLVRYMRPEWEQPLGANWIMVESLAEAARSLPGGARALLTTGQGGIEHFAERDDCHFILRVIEAPPLALPAHMDLLQARPPYGLEEEMALMQGANITHLVTKNSGGEQTSAKLEAARRLGIKVIMIARPAYGPALEADSIEGAIAAILD
ncbi:cobalt-precorrin-6A reductase [Devosia sp.]|uniref:cobalt-precorrin-6A reductase n=1 Tax=Devosia sp. TaxID=1871048 RepID=UPI002AFF9E77|nr:cobalt-precorrin-6A reductase [Devosia sp.]